MRRAPIAGLTIIPKLYKIPATAVAAIIHTFSIFIVMIPPLIHDADHLLGELFEVEALITLPHAVLGTINEILALVLILKWLANSLDPKKCKGKQLMRLTLIIWLISLISGILVYLLHLMG